ncbi:hypothetical protein M407DRAFT_30900 [Tulasnella calospora MUT 4182]|uniref:Uncharacterized protein n=1 Tax=Tulasnella calospora MUT 4182 TaxID=1051891 RepID=A0A0C3LDA7_9AGAM|nr:hypothetical protein M407DRAFT_30900 [Tulasnella calospora MUT 4182]
MPPSGTGGPFYDPSHKHEKYTHPCAVHDDSRPRSLVPAPTEYPSPKHICELDHAT